MLSTATLKELLIKFYLTVTCAALPAGSNTECIGDNLAGSAVGTNYTYECLDGYEPSSAGLFTECLPSGQWSLQTPECNEESKYIYVTCLLDPLLC